MTIVSPMGQLRPVFADKNGKRLSGGKVYTYEPGTLTPKATYTDALNLIPNTNPIDLDKYGEADIFLNGDYRIRVVDRHGTLIDDYDNLMAWATKRYLDSALSGFASGANKFYPTLADANADIANIAVNQVINIGELENGGLWFKESTESTTLTKAPYDAFELAKQYSNQKQVVQEQYINDLFAAQTQNVENLINQQGVSLQQLDNYYNYLMQRIAQIAVDKGWEASFVVDESGKNQQEINDFGGAEWWSKPFGYRLGATVKLANGDIAKSTVPNNTANPNLNMTGWVKANAASQIFDASGKSQQEINDNLVIPVNRTLTDKWNDTFNVKDKGAIGNGTTDDTITIQTTAYNHIFPKGVYKVTAPLLYKQNETWLGAGKGFNGTVIKPSGDFSALSYDAATPQRAKNTVSDIQIEAVNTTTAPAINLDNVYLSEFNRMWIRNSPVGINITNSDSVSFNQVMVMEDTKGEAVVVGDNSRSIKFFGCNFERNPGNAAEKAGNVRVEGNTGATSSASFFGCQLERSSLVVNAGTAKWYGGKIGAQSAVVFGAKSNNCFLDSDIYDGSSIYDFGFNNEILNAYSQNMQIPKFRWPNLIPESNTLNYSTVGDEYLFCVSAGTTTSSAVTNAQINIQDGANVLASSPVFNLQAAGVSVGLTKRPSYTFISCVKSITAQLNPAFVNCINFAIRGGKNILSNGTLVGGITGWSLTGATSTQDANDDTVITPTGAWRLYQDLAGKLIPGRKYIAMAKFSGAAQLVLGNAANGTVGAKTSYDVGIAGIYDTDKIAQIAFEFENGRTAGLSIGSIANDGVVTVKWIALIEVQDYTAPQSSKTFDPPSISAGASTITTVALANAMVGNAVQAAFSVYNADIEISAQVSSANTVTVKFKNTGAAAVDLASGTLTVKLI